MANLVNLKEVDAEVGQLNGDLKRLTKLKSFMKRGTDWNRELEEQIDVLIAMQIHWVTLISQLLHNNRDGRG